METNIGEDAVAYKVVVNDEEQYSIWPVHRDNPLGWRDAGKSGSKDECLAYINDVWTDMRPLSLRKSMESTGRQSH
jgi:MbtH protein